MARRPFSTSQSCWPSYGFTLIEILVVIATIAVLIAILLPSLAAARSQANRVTCQSNLKDLHRAWAMYLDAHKGYFPGGMNLQFNYGGLQGQGSSAFGASVKRPVPKPLNRYIGSPGWPLVLRQGGDVFCCPCDTGVQAMSGSVFRYCGTSYAANMLVIGRALRVPSGSVCASAWATIVGDPAALPPAPGLLDTLRTDDLIEPQRLILMGDAPWLYHWEEGLPDEFSYWHRTKGAHNLAFMDGHVDFVSMRKGIHVSAKYAVAPTRAVRDLLLPCQQEVPCPP